MQLLELKTANWRNLAPSRIDPSMGVNILLGNNAQGKTNFIEAVYYLSTARSFRGTPVGQLACWGSEGFLLTGRAAFGGRTVHYQVKHGLEGRELLVDGTPVRTVDEYFGGFNVVLFTPGHMSLVQGEPAGRRAFLDRALFCASLDHLELVRRYNRVLRERNACLKQLVYGGRGASAMLDSLDSQLAELGAVIDERRRRIVIQLGPLVSSVYEKVAGPEKAASLGYRSRSTSSQHESLDQRKESILQALAASRETDLRRGFTGVGPHQDDLTVKLAGRSARRTASQGEARTLVLALKLAELLWARDQRGETPVLLLDDLGSELDSRRRGVLFDHIVELGCQTFVTTVEPLDLVAGEVFYYKVENGVITRS